MISWAVSAADTCLCFVLLHGLTRSIVATTPPPSIFIHCQDTAENNLTKLQERLGEALTERDAARKECKVRQGAAVVETRH
jgi:hypothetical protein